MRARRTGSKRTIHYTSLGVRTHYVRSAIRRWRLRATFAPQHVAWRARTTLAPQHAALHPRTLCSLSNTPPASMRTVLA